MKGSDVLTGRSICLQGSNDAWFSNLVRPGVLHVYGLQEQNVRLLRYARRDRFHDLAVDRLFIVRDEILVQEFLDLVGGEPVFRCQ